MLAIENYVCYYIRILTNRSKQMSTQSIPTTVFEFVEACKTLDNDGIFTLFEDTISQDLRHELYRYSLPYNHGDVYDPALTFEPCRDAMITLGVKYNVQSLINF